MSSYSQRVSQLSADTQPKSGGRKVDTWRFARPSISSRVGRDSAITVDVYLVQDNRTAPLSFSARSAAFPAGPLSDPNIQVLHAQVLQVLTEQAEILDRTTWEPWLEVQSGLDIKGALNRENFAEQTHRLAVTYRPLLRGVHPDDPSRVFTINSNGTAVPFPAPRTPTTVDTSPSCLGGEGAEALVAGLQGYDSRTAGDTYAYLPDTPTNRAALDHILAGMETLSERLHALFEPSAIAHNLEHLDRSTLALPESRPTP